MEHFSCLMMVEHDTNDCDIWSISLGPYRSFGIWFFSPRALDKNCYGDRVNLGPVFITFCLKSASSDILTSKWLGASVFQPNNMFKTLDCYHIYHKGHFFDPEMIWWMPKSCVPTQKDTRISLDPGKDSTANFQSEDKLIWFETKGFVVNLSMPPSALVIPAHGSHSTRLPKPSWPFPLLPP